MRALWLLVVPLTLLGLVIASFMWPLKLRLGSFSCSLTGVRGSAAAPLANSYVCYVFGSPKKTGEAASLDVLATLEESEEWACKQNQLRGLVGTDGREIIAPSWAISGNPIRWANLGSGVRYEISFPNGLLTFDWFQRLR